jgi:hypothetical protein
MTCVRGPRYQDVDREGEEKIVVKKGPPTAGVLSENGGPADSNRVIYRSDRMNNLSTYMSNVRKNQRASIKVKVAKNMHIANVLS